MDVRQRAVFVSRAVTACIADSDLVRPEGRRLQNPLRAISDVRDDIAVFTTVILSIAGVLSLVWPAQFAFAGPNDATVGGIIAAGECSVRKTDHLVQKRSVLADFVH